MNQLATKQVSILPEKIEKALIEGRLEELNTEERLVYFHQICESLGLNPITKPFEYIKLNNKLTLYATKNATEQIRRNMKISITGLQCDVFDDVVRYTAYGQTPDGYADTASGCVSIKGLQGEAKSNAYMKAETKAKRRLTLSMGGLGMLDETEIETIPNRVNVTSSIVEAPKLTVRSLDDWLSDIAFAVDIDELKSVYKAAYRVLPDPAEREAITDAKDARKRMLDVMAEHVDQDGVIEG
jgi:hypothetical protein